MKKFIKRKSWCWYGVGVNLCSRCLFLRNKTATSCNIATLVLLQHMVPFEKMNSKRCWIFVEACQQVILTILQRILTGSVECYYPKAYLPLKRGLVGRMICPFKFVTRNLPARISLDIYIYICDYIICRYVSSRNFF